MVNEELNCPYCGGLVIPFYDANGKELSIIGCDSCPEYWITKKAYEDECLRLLRKAMEQ